MAKPEKTELLPPDALKGKTLGLSVSDSPDLDRLGLLEEHFRLALGEIGRSILVSGGHIFYGGHLQAGGYTTFLVDELQRWGRRDRPLKICLAWTEHSKMEDEELNQLRREFGLLAEIILLDQDGQQLPKSYKKDRAKDDFDRETNAQVLTGLRRFLASRTDARILLGGKREGFQGEMPGIVEEALVSIELGKPLFLAGGFGGATLDIIRVLTPENAEWFPVRQDSSDDAERVKKGLDRVSEAAETMQWDVTSNGLTAEENALLAATYRPSEIAALVSLGLGRMLKKTEW